MTRIGSTKKKDAAYAAGRLIIARGFLKSARSGILIAEPGDIGNPSMSTVINCAIAYSDALTAKMRGEINQDDHQAVVKLLRAALGNEFPSRQETILRMLLEQKDEVQYGSRAKTLDEADRSLARLEEFAAWAEERFVLSR